VDDADPQELPLREALIRWCDGTLVQSVQTAERKHTVHDLVGSHRARLVPDDELRKPLKQEWMIGAPNYANIISA
jgi:hypothetical protein